MASKTYIPGAVVVTEKALKYLTRYQGVLSAGASTQQLSAIADLIACLAKFLQEWHKPSPV